MAEIPLIAHSAFPLYLGPHVPSPSRALYSQFRTASNIAYMSAPRTAGWGQNKEFCRALT